MAEVTFETRREELRTYFDETARDNWVKLTSKSPVSRIRETVRRGREEMRNTLLSWLPEDLAGARVLDAGCGTGQMAVELARRGAEVVAIDISPALIEEAKKRLPEDVNRTAIRFMAGDMHDASLGTFDHVIAMDSLIHYPKNSMVDVLENFADRTTTSIAFTFAPRTPALAAMKAIGRFFPKNDRAPAIEPVAEGDLLASLALDDASVSAFSNTRSKLVSTGFYKSRALQLTRTEMAH